MLLGSRRWSRAGNLSGWRRLLCFWTFRKPSTACHMMASCSKSHKAWAWQGAGSHGIFNVYINDILEHTDGGVYVPGEVEKLKGLLFADDVVLLGENTIELQKRLRATEEWAANWGLALNAKKCGFVRFNAGPGGTNPLKISSGTITEVSEYVYLGTVFEEREEGSGTARQKRRGEAMLAQTAGALRNPNLPFLHKGLIIKNMISSGVIYGAESRGGTLRETKVAQSVVNRAATLAFGRGVSLGAIFREIGLPPVQAQVFSRQKNLLVKAATSQTVAASILCPRRRQKGRTWLNRAQGLLRKAGWQKQDEEPEECLRELVWQRWEKRNKSKALARYKRLGLENTRKILLQEAARSPKLTQGFRRLLTLRTGIFGREQGLLVPGLPTKGCCISVQPAVPTRPRTRDITSGAVQNGNGSEHWPVGSQEYHPESSNR
eukprot:GHVN01059628.1.p1 GENE.GHVN01059628.1~~GHVN01059628.1.p1  ORF type:complete len:434 (-),score=-6.92 GHVN01059628.1:17-1318(-)